MKHLSKPKDFLDSLKIKFSNTIIQSDYNPYEKDLILNGFYHILESLSKNEKIRDILLNADTIRKYKGLNKSKFLDFAEVILSGYEAFENLDKLNLWFFEINSAMGNVEPITYMTYPNGRDILLGELTGINYGIFT